MDFNLDELDAQLDAEDLDEIYHMVSEWEANFGSDVRNFIWQQSMEFFFQDDINLPRVLMEMNFYV